MAQRMQYRQLHSLLYRSSGTMTTNLLDLVKTVDEDGLACLQLIFYTIHLSFNLEGWTHEYLLLPRKQFLRLFIYIYIYIVVLTIRKSCTKN